MDWVVILSLVLLSLSFLMNGAINFCKSGWSLNDAWFPFVFALLGLTAFIIPIFINRAVWGLDVWWFSKQFRAFVDKDSNRIYWEQRFSVETMQKLYTNPKYAGRVVFFESFFIVVILSWAVSGFFPSCLLSCREFWIIASVFALTVAFLLHIPWPSHIQPKKEGLPLVLGGTKDMGKSAALPIDTDT